MTGRIAASFAVVAAIAPAPLAATADTCGPAEGVDYVLPVDGSSAVHPAARIVVRYALASVSSPALVPPTVSLRSASAEVPTTSSWDGREVVLTPVEPLAASTHHVVTVGRPGRSDWQASFDTAAAAGPAEPPVLGTTLSASAEYLGGGPEGDDACGPIGLERYRVHLMLPAAQGSSGLGNVAYVAFETAGPGVTEPTEVARWVDATAGEEVGFDFYLPADGVHGHACFRVLAVDVTGAPSGTTEEACARLAEGPFFRSLCATAAAGHSSISPLAVLVCVALLALSRRGRGRGRGRNGRDAT